MDNSKFGDFVLSLREEKGLTQDELANMLHVTNQTVSEWESGQCFPDIQMIEPLATALGVSAIEIMKSEKLNSNNTHSQNAFETITDSIDGVSLQRKIESKNIIIGLLLIPLVILSIFTLDQIPIEAILLMYLPIILFGIGVFMIVMSIRRKRRKMQYRLTLTLGILALLYPLIAFLFLAFAMVIGGPVPT